MQMLTVSRVQHPLSRLQELNDVAMHLKVLGHPDETPADLKEGL